MSKPFPLQAVLDLMQTRSDDAARELGRRLMQEQNAKNQLKLLEDYRHEYCDRFRVAAQNGMSPQQWSNFQDFLGKLDEAIAVQTNTVAASASQREEGQRLWLHQKSRLQAFDTLADRHKENERVSEGRREQKSLDEIAARKSGEREHKD